MFGGWFWVGTGGGGRQRCDFLVPYGYGCVCTTDRCREKVLDNPSVQINETTYSIGPLKCLYVLIPVSYVLSPPGGGTRVLPV